MHHAHLLVHKLDQNHTFTLYTSSGEVIAECQVRHLRPICPCINPEERYEFNDVEVRKPFRGQNYCSLLLLNAMLFFDQHADNPERLVFQLYAARRNHAARRAYRKVFGPPDGIYKNLVFFTTSRRI